MSLALVSSDLFVGDSDQSQLFRLAVGKLVHRCKRDVECSCTSVVDSEHIDALAIVGELPAGSTARGVESTDSESATNVGETGERAEVSVA